MSILKGGEDILSKSDDAYNSAFLGADLELDGSRRREISLYRNDEVVLSVEHGVTLGLLKLIYSSDSNFHGVLQGVRSRPNSNEPSLVASVILSDDRVLDQDEYELIIQDQPTRADILQQTIETQLPLQSSTLPLAQQQQSSTSNSNNNNMHSAYAKNTRNSDKKMGQFVCEYCHLPFISKAKFLRHRRIHTEENPYICVYCNETFSHHADLRKHRDENHMTNKTFKCNYCPKTFATRAELKGHLWRHTGEKNHKCRICGKTFATKGNLKLHIDKHIGVHKHKCPFCPQRFTSHSSLEAHMAKHTGMKAYKCRFCQKSYSQAGQLTSHERLHTGEKPFICQVCGKEFRLNSTRLAHEKRHTGDRPHICDTCGRSFSMPDHLRRHLKTHENKLDRLVSCPFCKKKIFAGRNMRKHLARHRELGITEAQAKAISGSLKPDREQNERDSLDYDQTSVASNTTKTKTNIRCIECNEEVKNTRKLIEHLTEEHYHRELTALERKEIRLRHGLQKLHHCQFCSSYFIDYRLLRSHVLAEHAEHAEDVGIIDKNAPRNTNAGHKCPNCSMYFQLRTALDMHIIRDHLSTVIETSHKDDETLLQFRCWYCAQSFQTPEEVVTHMTKQHESLDLLSKRVEMTTGEDEITSSGLWTCTHCNDILKNEVEYRKHVAQHLQESSFTLIRPRSDDPVDKSLDENQDGEDCVVKKYLKSNGQITIDNTPPSSNNTPPSSTITSSSLTENNYSENAQQNEKDTIDFGLVEKTDTKAAITQFPEEEKMEEEKNKTEDSSMMINNSELHEEVTAIEKSEEIQNISVIDNQTTMEDDVKEKNFSSLTVKPTEAPALPINSLQIVTNDTISVINTNNTTLSSKVKKMKKKKKEKTKSKQKDSTIVTGENNRVGLVMESCRYCADVFNDKNALEQHLKRVHSQSVEVPFRCWFCSVTFSSPEEVVTHMTNEHDNLDNLSRRIEETELKNPINTPDANNDAKSRLLKLTTAGDASLSPIDNNYRCPKCSKQLESKEAFELHIMVHEAMQHNQDLLKTSAELLVRHHRMNEHTTNTTSIEDVALTDEPMTIDTTNSTPFTADVPTSNETFELNRNLITASVTASTKVNVLSSPTSSHANASSIENTKTVGKNYTTIIQTKKEKKKTESHKKPKKTSRKTLTNRSANSIVLESGLNPAVNICIHCSRAFCGKKALDVHTLKMHGKEYLQRQPTTRILSPFTCWFCAAHFPTPELVVEHMTSAHENLDMLSKRIEEQEIPNQATVISQEKPNTKIAADTSRSYIQIAPQKTVIPVSNLNSAAALETTAPALAQEPNENPPQPPPGFKMSYALAYVPVFVPEKNDSDDTVKS